MKSDRCKGCVAVSLGLGALAGLILLALFSKEETRRFKSPDGRYECVVTRYRYENFIPGMPGQGSDYSCFLSIYDENGKHCGTIPVPMAWMVHDIKWTESGASLTAIGEWDFANQTCLYWNEDQTRQISGL